MNRREFLTLTGAAAGAVVLCNFNNPLFAQIIEEEKAMSYTAKDYSKLIGMEGFSETILGKTATPEFSELKRRLGWEFNGMRLHEYYFENLGGKSGINKEGKLAKKMAEDFGDYATWEKDFRAVGAMRGIGWAVLYQDNTNGKLINFWINEHDVSHPAGCNPLLILDVFEHAFMLDYGLKRADYLEAFFKNINWSVVEARLK